MNNPFEQSYLAGFAPKKSLDNYAKGADPRVINDIIALSELKEQAAMRQRAALASGAAQGQMPTVRDKIIQMFQQANQPRQQPQQQPNPMAQGIMAQARPPMQPQVPQEAPPEAQMYHGGVARLPVSDRMFGYAGGGIIAFSGKERSDVPRIGEEVPLSPEERARLERELEMRLIGERARAEAAGETDRPSVDDAASRIPGQSVRAPANKERVESSELGRNIANTMAAFPGAGAVKGFFGGVRGALGGLGSLANREDNQSLVANSFAPTDATVKPAPTGKPQLQGPRTLVGDAADEQARLEKAYQASQTSDVSQAIEQERARLESQGKKMTPDDVRAIAARFAKQAQNVGIAQPTNLSDGQKRVNGMTLNQFLEHSQKRHGPLDAEQRKILIRRFNGAEADPVTTPPQRTGIAQNLPATPATNAAKPSVTTPTTTTPAQDQESKLMDLMMKQFGPQPAVESTEDRLKKRDEYVKNAPTSEEALALIKHYDRMAKRYEANDQAEEAQKAINARNNLWTFLTNTRGSSLGVAAGKADAALQPLLSAQETRRQSYQKQRDEQEMLLGKARYEIAQAERARKEGRYADAEKSEMEAKKLQEQARGHNIQGLGSLINAAGLREERRLSREQSSEDRRLAREQSDRHFGIQMEEMRLRREQMREDSQRIKDQNERTQRENAYGRQSAETRKAIEKAQKMLEMPGLPDDIKVQAQATLTRLQKQDNDMYERIVVRGDVDYRPSPTMKGGNSALTSKADKIVGIGAK